MGECGGGGGGGVVTFGVPIITHYIAGNVLNLL
jgi:hypothetical protein